MSNLDDILSGRISSSKKTKKRSNYVEEINIPELQIKAKYKKKEENKKPVVKKKAAKKVIRTPVAERKKPVVNKLSDAIVKKTVSAPSVESVPEKRWSPSLPGMDKHDVNTLVAGATPLVLGLLTGTQGDALDISVAGMKEQEGIRREDDLSLMSYLRKRTLANKKAIIDSSGSKLKRRYQKANIEKEGKTYAGGYDTFTNKYNVTEHLSGYSQKIMKDPVTGELATVSGSTGVGRPTDISGSKNRPLNVKEEKDVKDVRKAFLGDKEVQGARKSISASEGAIEVLNSRNPIGDEATKTIFPRMFGEVGNLAAAEQERFSGSPELRRLLEKYKSKWKKGLLTEDDRGDLIKIADLMADYSQKRLDRLIKGYSKSEENVSGIKSSVTESSLNPIAGRTFVESRPEVDYNDIAGLSDKDLAMEERKLIEKAGK